MELSDSTKNWQDHEKKVTEVKAEFALRKQSKNISLKPKSTSHFFRERAKKNKLDLTKLNQVIEINVEKGYAEVEGCINFYDFSAATLEYGFLPQVVPELRNITIGGTISGLGVESTSFRFGLVHDTVLEYEVLTGSGEVVVCSPSQNSDLFYGLPNSLGTIGYILRCRVKLIPAKRFVRLKLTVHTDHKEYFKELKQKCRTSRADFLEGYLSSPSKLVIVEGYFSDQFKQSQVYNWKDEPFWKFLNQAPEGEYSLSISDYLWRWDRDVFWTLENIGFVSRIIKNKFTRRLLGNLILRSDVWVLLNKYNRKLRSNSFFRKFLVDESRENILQDYVLDIEKCSEFFQWYNQDISVYPVWICPIKNVSVGKYPMHVLQGDFLVDIGVYSGKKRAKGIPPNYYNGLLDRKIQDLNGFKGLYSTTLVAEKEFWAHYKKKEYFQVKNAYDPDGTFPDVFKKAVGSVTL